jgi:hypothetical protein
MEEHAKFTKGAILFMQVLDFMVAATWKLISKEP